MNVPSALHVNRIVEVPIAVAEDVGNAVKAPSMLFESIVEAPCVVTEENEKTVEDHSIQYSVSTVELPNVGGWKGGGGADDVARRGC